MAYTYATPTRTLSAIQGATSLYPQSSLGPSSTTVSPYINPQTGQVSTSPWSVAPGSWTTYQPQQVGAQYDPASYTNPISYDPSTTTTQPTQPTSSYPTSSLSSSTTRPQQYISTPNGNFPVGSESVSGSSSGSYNYDPLALARLNNESALALQNDQQSYASSDWERRLAAIQSLAGGTGSGGSSGGGTSGGGTSADEQASRNAAFARAKDQQGQTARASLDALRGIMSESGTLGSGMEAMGQSNIISGAASDLGDFERERLMSDSDRAASIADRNYAGDLTRQSLEQQRFQALLGILTSGRAY